ncbi:dolichyl-phosphate beta-glucosyltransferase [Didymosphaeria variabile]|uniref:dolichyl-phosphate beta-glucosyltransferase n=1 Tax=Didymosphaeria variabile TaxID=1932322 RepID=A0A9W8XPG0_9PLEO|nr:dolichyl-phosphate beta-glucosyltransferase [Didymosphaeria variabile]KAJ4355817.1 dolichyl-phosphate beta-glucosyltransferase [Didymosphaeria variabile]
MLCYMALVLFAPVPREPRRSEKQYITVLPNGERSEPRELPCWIDKWTAEKEVSKKRTGGKRRETLAKIALEEPELFMSVVVPAYNEEERLTGMLEEAVDYLQQEFAGRGWEIILVSDGSTDKTVDKALQFAREHQLSKHRKSVSGPWKDHLKHEERIPEGSIRIVELEANRGKGGAVTHGMRHVRGKYVVFADADGASRFSDLGKLVEGCERVEDDRGRGVAIGSRAHLVGSEAVVKRSKLRNFLMHSFHLLLRLMTPPATAAIADTQCGFKLFSRPALPYIIPYMHSEGWIFDVEMLMLAESGKIPMVEVAIGWKEVLGSKLNVVWDSLGMAWGLAVLRAAWLTGVYKRD